MFFYLHVVCHIWRGSQREPNLKTLSILNNFNSTPRYDLLPKRGNENLLPQVGIKPVAMRFIVRRCATLVLNILNIIFTINDMLMPLSVHILYFITS